MKNKIRNLLVLFNDQIAFPIKQNENFDKKQDYILFIEPAEFFFKSNHHKKKLVFILSSFRNYAEELKKENYNILYEKIEDNVQRDTINIICDKYLKEYHIEKLTFIEPSDYDLEQNIKKIKHEKEILIDNSFYCNKLEFKKWAEAQKNILMENFYRYLRKKHNILIENNKPTGGKWNFDSMNRESINKKTMIKKQNLYFPENNFIKKIIKVVDTFFKDNIGNTSNYNFGYTKKDAKLRINYFFKNHLKEFGKFQDAMVEENEYINHSIISMYLNNGLLKPKDVIDSSIDFAKKNQDIPLNSLEGFIRQILGWREFIRGIYWLKMPNYKESNFFSFNKKIPGFYWDYKTNMNCIKQSVKNTIDNSYAHHIQRLMILGNFALLAHIDPKEVQDWFLCVYADAYEWVEMPNVIGMALFADGGVFSTKPYIASGNYINKMSNYCQNCIYNQKTKIEEDSCPFNYLYWNFLIKNQKELKNNPRLFFPYNNLAKMKEIDLIKIQKNSTKFLEEIS